VRLALSEDKVKSQFERNSPVIIKVKNVTSGKDKQYYNLGDL
jgi:hypothetical protein